MGSEWPGSSTFGQNRERGCEFPTSVPSLSLPEESHAPGANGTLQDKQFPPWFWTRSFAVQESGAAWQPTGHVGEGERRGSLFRRRGASPEQATALERFHLSLQNDTGRQAFPKKPGIQKRGECVSAKLPIAFAETRASGQHGHVLSVPEVNCSHAKPCPLLHASLETPHFHPASPEIDVVGRRFVGQNSY